MPTTSLLAAATDGRAQNPRYIQRQLRALHDALLRDADVLQQAAVADGRMNADEALLEVSLVLAAVREHFLRFDVKHMLDEEYRVANGQDWLTRRLPADIVYIRPQPHTWLYSAIIAFSSAIAAGCCVMLEVGFHSTMS
jgi:acyl-CoA reductase-like NAD-dependent aldehyde dehydrogenase